MNKTMSDKIIAELKSVIGDMEVNALKLANVVHFVEDKKLVHTTKIIVGTIQAIRMYVLGNVDRLKSQVEKGGDSIGKGQSEKAKRHQRQSPGHARRSK